MGAGMLDLELLRLFESDEDTLARLARAYGIEEEHSER